MHKALAAVLLIALAFGCSSEPGGSAEGGAAFANANCPMMGDPVDPEGATVQFQGHTIGFCCDNCAPKFEQLSDTEKLAKLAEAGFQPGT
jgi:hypothetical protein